MEGSHSLEKFINGVAKDVDDPEAKVSSWKRNQAALVLSGETNARNREDLHIGALGSGSDFTPFLQHLGIASLNIGYGGEDDAGIYHSIYDDFYWYTHFSDTSFVYGRALAQAAGIAVLRLANADVIPFAYTNLSETVRTYATELQKLRDSRAKDIAERKKQIADGLFGIVSDPHAPTTAPHVDSLPPQFNFAPLLNAVEALSAAAAEFDKAYAAWRDKPPVMQASAATNATKLASVNERLVKAERAFLLADGLKNRPWFKHSLYAPGFYTGYGVKTVPGVRESLEQGTWQDVDGEIARVAATIQREASLVRQAATDLASVR